MKSLMVTMRIRRGFRVNEVNSAGLGRVELLLRDTGPINCSEPVGTLLKGMLVGISGLKMT